MQVRNNHPLVQHYNKETVLCPAHDCSHSTSQPRHSLWHVCMCRSKTTTLLDLGGDLLGTNLWPTCSHLVLVCPGPNALTAHCVPGTPSLMEFLLLTRNWDLCVLYRVEPVGCIGPA
jgi:hypothetical protein